MLLSYFWLILLYLSDPNQFPHSAVQASNPSAYILSGQRAPRHYVNPAPHNVSEMKNNHIPSMAHGKKNIF